MSDRDFQQSMKTMFVLLAVTAAGFAFGFSAEKARVFEPVVIRAQMVFDKWIMLKMFMAAMGTSALVFLLLSVINVNWIQTRYDAAVSAFESCVESINGLRVVCGGLILGLGMTLAGSCPGMVFPQTGAWVYMAIVTLVGGLLGSFVFGLMHDGVIDKIFKKGKLVFPLSIHKSLKVKYAIFAIIIVIVCAVVVVVLEVQVPWKDEVPYFANKPDNIFKWHAWPPSLCGVFIGLLQLAVICLVDDTLGGSGASMTIASQVAIIKPVQDKFPYLEKKRCGLGNWWQVFYVCGAIIGGAISAWASGTHGTVQGVHWYYALVGGFFLTFGARLADGCTSGHGLSGSALLMTSSFVAVACMFAAGIGIAFAMKATEVLYKFGKWS